MNKRKKMGLASMLMIPSAVALMSLAACEDKGPAEKAGEQIDEAVDDAGDALEDTADDLEDGVD